MSRRRRGCHVDIRRPGKKDRAPSRRYWGHEWARELERQAFQTELWAAADAAGLRKSEVHLKTTAATDPTDRLLEMLRDELRQAPRGPGALVALDLETWSPCRDAGKALRAALPMDGDHIIALARRPGPGEATIADLASAAARWTHGGAAALGRLANAIDAQIASSSMPPLPRATPPDAVLDAAAAAGVDRPSGIEHVSIGPEIAQSIKRAVDRRKK